MTNYDQKKIDYLKWINKSASRILDLIVSGDNDAEIVRKLGVNQSRIKHYRKVITIQDE